MPFGKAYGVTYLLMNTMGVKLGRDEMGRKNKREILKYI